MGQGWDEKKRQRLAFPSVWEMALHVPVSLRLVDSDS